MREKLSVIKQNILFPYYYIKYRFGRYFEITKENIINKKIVIFSLPDALITQYLDIFETISKNYNNAYFISCYDEFNYCSAKQMNGINHKSTRFENLKVCNKCQSSLRKKIKSNNYISINQFSRTDRVDFSIDSEIEKNTILSLSNYDTMLYFKQDILDFDTEQIKFKELVYLDSLKYIKFYSNLINSKKYEIEKVYFYDHYSSISSVKLFLKNKKIKCFSLYKSLFNNTNSNLVKITSKINYQDSLLDESYFESVKYLPIKTEYIDWLSNEIVDRQTTAGTHIYSEKKSGKINISIPENKKVIVAFNSSNDEYKAFEEHYRSHNLQSRRKIDDAFDNQFEWLEFLIEKIEKSDNLFLIIRLHPRLYVNHRDNNISKDYFRYKKILGGHYLNTKVIWPEEKISAYDLFELADVATISWSSISDELSRLGIKSVTGLTKFFFINDNSNIYKENTKEKYWNRLIALLSSKTTLDDIKIAFRFSYFKTIAQYQDICTPPIEETDILEDIDKLMLKYDGNTNLKIEENAIIKNLIFLINNDLFGKDKLSVSKIRKNLIRIVGD